MINVVLYTNTAISIEVKILRELLAQFQFGHFDLVICDNLDNPLELTWQHRQLISDRFLSKDNDYTHFIYVEDDIRISFANFCYFKANKTWLANKGLIPGFLRVEYSKANHKYMSTDAIRRSNVKELATVEANGRTFVAILDPYYGGYIVDKQLAAEFVQSKSFCIKESASVIHWEVRERAAMGLLCENVPEYFPSRYVVPLSGASSVANDAWVEHLPHNYADVEGGLFASIAVNDLLV